MADELAPEPAERYAFVADDKTLVEEELAATRPDGYAAVRPRSIPYRYENWGDLSALLAVSQELTARIEQLRQAKPGSQVAADDAALGRGKPDGLGYMTAFIEQCLMDISTHSEAIGLLASHPYTRATRAENLSEFVYGSSSAIAVHQRAIIENASLLLSVISLKKPRDRYLRLVQEVRDEMVEWDHRMMAEQYQTAALPMEEFMKRVVARYALDFDKSAQKQARSRAEAPKKSRTTVIRETLGDDVYWVWKRTTVDSHGSVLLSQTLLAEDSPFSQAVDARYRANGVFESVRRVLNAVKNSLETTGDDSVTASR